MAENPPTAAIIPPPVPGTGGLDESSEAEKRAATAEHHDTIDQGPIENDAPNDLHKTAAIATIQQQHTIPTTGKRLPTSKWEYIFFCVFCTLLPPEICIA